MIAEAGQPALRLAVERARWEDEVEVWFQAVPVHFTQAGNFGAEILRITVESYGIAELHAQTPRQPFVDRHFTGFRRPVACDQRIVIRQAVHPRQVQLAVHRLTARIVRFDDIGSNLVVNFGQTYTHNRIEGFRRGFVLMQEIRHLRDLLFSDVEQEIIRAVRRQLLLPAIQQVPAHHQQQGQQHKRHRERRQLAQRYPRLTQKAVHRQTQRQLAECQAAQ